MTQKEIKHRLTILNLQLEVALEEYESICRRINKRITMIQTICKHKHKTFHPDPSGNNDSFYSCDICDKEGKHL